MRRSVRGPALAAAGVLLLLGVVARAHPVARPLVERLAVLTVAGAVLAALALAVARRLPEPAVSALDAPPVERPPPPALPLELRRLATTGGRSLVQRVGRERLAARGLDPDDPADAEAARALAGPDLWALVASPLERPVDDVDLVAALARLEAL